GALQLTGDHRGHLVDLVRLDLLAGGQCSPHVGERPLLVDLDEPLVVTVRDEQARRVRADVDAGTAHDRERTGASTQPTAGARARTLLMSDGRRAWSVAARSGPVAICLRVPNGLGPRPLRAARLRARSTIGLWLQARAQPG